MRVALIGSGSWGTTVASLAVRNCSTTLWARKPQVARGITQEHSNSAYQPGFTLPDSLSACSDLGQVVRDADLAGDVRRPL